MLATFTPTVAVALCRVASAAAMSAAAAPARRAGSPQIARQGEARKADVLTAILARQPAEISHQLVALLRQLLLERRQRRLCLGEVRLLGEHVGLRHRAQLELALHQLELFFLGLDDVVGGVDLGPQRCVEMAAVTTLAVRLR